MSAADWSRVNDVFHRALDEPSERRAAFLAEACKDDPAVLAEVTSLLEAHAQADQFIETPPADAAALLDRAFDEGLAAGTAVGHYVIIRTLGEGGMGVVYLAEDTRLGRTVALKAVAPRYTGDPTRRERLRREARAAAALSHPGIATVYALEEVGEHIYIASEYVPGETLRDELNRGPLPVQRVIDTAIGLARALAVAHDRGLVHRDLKPENLMRSASGDLKILDFGLARFRDDQEPLAALTQAGAVLGTPAYMSPEQIRGQVVDFRSDLFSIGGILYELATGVHPFGGADPASTIARILETDPVRLVDRQPPHGADAPAFEALDEIVRTCLRKAPGDRYASTHALVGALARARAAMADEGSGARGASRTPHAPPAVGVSRPAAAPSPLWWWQFHQAAASLAYCGLLYPLWRVHTWTPGLGAMLLFLAGLVAVIVATTLRLHLWFTLRSYPTEWVAQRSRTALWIRLADAVFVGALIVASAAVLTTRAHIAVLLVSAAVGVLLSFTIIEPATTRAAFQDQ